MADLRPETREELTDKYDIKCPGSDNLTLSPAPNDKMPNAHDYDFRCTGGSLHNMSDVVEDVVKSGSDRIERSW